MRLPQRIFLSAVIALSSGAVTATDPPKASQPAQAPEILAAMDVVIAADGSVASVVPDATLPEQVRKLLIARVSQWRYEVPTWQGKPARVSTRLILRLQAVPTTAGGFVMRVLRTETDLFPNPPEYPGSARTKRAVGTFIYAFRVETDGSFTNIERKFPAEVTDKPIRALDESAQRSLRASHWRPFVVDGTPILCEFLLPIGFVLPDAKPPASVDSKPFRDALANPCPQPALRTKIENTLL